MSRKARVDGWIAERDREIEPAGGAVGAEGGSGDQSSPTVVVAGAPGPRLEVTPVKSGLVESDGDLLDWSGQRSD